jgi:hypothetical protein
MLDLSDIQLLSTLGRQKTYHTRKSDSAGGVDTHSVSVPR